MSTRREFLKQMGMATAGLAMSGASSAMATPVSSKQRAEAKNEKVKIAYIGIGFRGEQDIMEFKKTNMVDVVALCDIDIGAKHTQKVLDLYPKAKRFRDFREMFEKYSSHFDAVCAAVPDHMHFPVAMMASACVAG